MNKRILLFFIILSMPISNNCFCCFGKKKSNPDTFKTPPDSPTSLKSFHSARDADECAICFEAIRGNETTMTNCNETKSHFVHKDCWNKWKGASPQERQCILCYITS